MKNRLLFYAILVTIVARAQVVNLQTPATTLFNHGSVTPKDFSINGSGLNTTYLWTEEISLLQHVNINLYKTDKIHVYLQRTNSRLAFNLLTGGTTMSELKINYDNQGWNTVCNTINRSIN